jgi:hypothetical protein
MANTITYDPSDDPQVLASDEARDADNLAQGERMADEQAGLLAGKYKNAEELEKAYLELQSKQGSQETTQETTQETESEYGQPYQEDGAVNYDTVEQLYGNEVTAIMEDANIDPFVMSKHFNENNGTLTDEMVKQLTDAGFAPGMVDTYLKGAREEFGFAEGADLSDADVSEVQQIAGGKAQYDNLTQWATNNLPAEEVRAFDEVMNTGNKAAVKFAVRALNAQYEDAIGRNPDLVTGKAPSMGVKYRSMAEVVRDMGDPRYDSDPAYRADIQQKLERSDLKV